MPTVSAASSVYKEKDFRVIIFVQFGEQGRGKRVPSHPDGDSWISSLELTLQLSPGDGFGSGKKVFWVAQIIGRMLHSGAVELRNEIGRSVGLSLPGTLVFDYPTMAAIVAFLQTKIPSATASLEADDDTLATIPPAMYALLPLFLVPIPSCCFY